MIEIPEALTVANQVNQTIRGRKIVNVVAAYSPHKFAWYHGDPQGYHVLLAGREIAEAHAHGGMVHIKAGGANVVVGDGAALRYHQQGAKRPAKHQLLLELDDSSAVTASIQMYGGVWCFRDGDFNNPYYLISRSKPSTLSSEFNEEYFDSLIWPQEVQGLSIKAFLATEQRIPGLGNGVLQDILWRAKLHPRKKVHTLNEKQKKQLYVSIKTVLGEMTGLGGRDTEKDFFGSIGGYRTVMSKNNTDAPCLMCGEPIKKENYLGGSIYYCPSCQHL